MRGFVSLPTVNFPNLGLPRDPVEITGAMIEEAAEACRRHWRLGDGPISNVVLLLENNGAIVTRQDLAADKLDAFSMWPVDDPAPYVVLNSEKGSAVRSRFDVAHELGHLVLHRGVLPGTLDRSEMFALIESQAHAFARAFLMPAATFPVDLTTPALDAFRCLKPKWKVSIQAMIFRSKDLRLVSDDQLTRLWANLARRGWRTCEPLDDELEPESPRLLRRSIELLVKSGAATRQDIVFQNALPAEDIEDLMGLDRGFLRGPSNDEPRGDGPDHGMPTILRFPIAG